MIGMIAAISANGMISRGDGKMPFHYPEDLKLFKTTTLNSTVIMGRKTFESIGKPLPMRRNVVITSNPIQNIECYASIPEALKCIEHSFDNKIWFIGGACIYEEAMEYTTTIILNVMPDIIKDKNRIQFPYINDKFTETKSLEMYSNNTLRCYWNNNSTLIERRYLFCLKYLDFKLSPTTNNVLNFTRSHIYQ